MSCQNCKSDRLITAGGKVSDTFSAYLGEHSYEGYVSSDLGIGRGDYIELEYCGDCGQIQGNFPLQPTCLETSSEDSDDSDE